MMKAFFKKYHNIQYVFIFLVIYMIGFLTLEYRTPSQIFITDTWIDQYIPFCEYFVIAYLLWFVFIALGFAYFIFIDQSGFQRTCFYLFVGMSLVLIIYLVFPNGQNQRVALNNENIFQTLVSFIYSVDSPTNVCPSLHVYNSIMMCISLLKSEYIKNHSYLSMFIIIIAFFISVSTVMIKQHAFIDVIAAIVLSICIYQFGKLKLKY